MKKKPQETDLYEPIQTHFLNEGFKVYGEVNDCDIAIVKDNELIIIELKLNLTVDLLIQATKRQNVSSFVYIAIPKPKKYNPRSRRWKDTCRLIKRLELGLILVDTSKSKIEIPFHPAIRKGQNKAKQQKIINEIDGRSGNYNIGGSSKKKIITAYRENCIQIACLLKELGELSPKQLKQLGTGEKTSSILSKNYYGWFKRVKRGVYVLTAKGNDQINHYPELVKYYTRDDLHEHNLKG